MTPHRCCPARHSSPTASSGRRGRTSVFWFKARKPTTSRSPITFQSALRELNPPRQRGKLAPLPLGQGHARRKERESNPQGSSLGRFRGGCHRQLACPSVKAAVAGIEPASGRLTAAYPYQHGSHRNQVRTAGVEPAISCARDQRCASVPGGIPGFPTSCCKSAQRELNPHFRHGKAAGCRYIMGAIYVGRIVKDREHRAGVEPTLPRYECGVLATGRPVRVLKWDQRDLNPGHHAQHGRAD